jgi:ubiquinone/menaquinone biosynthesis C-methylase UbiE
MDREFWEKEWLDSTDIASTYYLMLELPQLEKALDIGCGDWKYAEFFYSKNDFTVGCDIAFNALKKAKDNSSLHKQKIDLVQCDARYLPFRENSFDGVVSVETLTLTGQDHRKVLDEMYRVTRDYLNFNVTHAESLPREKQKAEIDRVAFDENELIVLIKSLSLERFSISVLTESEVENLGVPFYHQVYVPDGDKKKVIWVVARKGSLLI